MQKISIWNSWPFIIFLIFFFWPVGLYKAYRRAYTGSEPSQPAGIFLILCGILFFLIGVSGFSETESGGPSYSFVVYCWIAGILMIRIGVKVLREGKRTAKYKELIGVKGITSIDDLASGTGRTYEKTVKDLVKMIQNGYIEGYHILEDQRALVAKGVAVVASAPGSVDRSQNQENVVGNTGGSIVVKCPNCGASNSVTTGSTAACEYCGAVIQ